MNQSNCLGSLNSGEYTLWWLGVGLSQHICFSPKKDHHWKPAQRVVPGFSGKGDVRTGSICLDYLFT